MTYQPPLPIPVPSGRELDRPRTSGGTVTCSIIMPMPASLAEFASEYELYFSQNYLQWFNAQDYQAIRKKLRKKIEDAGHRASVELPVEIMLDHPEFIVLSATGRKSIT